MMLPLPQLRRWRLARFWTQEELAERSGIAVATIHRLESNLPARLKTIRKLAEALGVEPQQLTAPEAEPGEQEAA